MKIRFIWPLSLKKNSEVETLITQLENNSNDLIRIAAIKELGKVYDPRTTRCLRKTLLDPDKGVRLAALNEIVHF